ncbi:MAG: NUDIX hydrolase [Candidatus Cloacimonetes bacterium]|nr:NUDIX hydrolase [Candidatus Cloacimonadota bacterium]
MSRQKYPIPVVRAVIRNDAGEILLLKRSNCVHYDNLWCLPGGKIDAEDTIEQSLRRELAEETALTVKKAKFLFYIESMENVQDSESYITFYFECTVEGEIKLNKESMNFAWIGKESFDEYQYAFNTAQVLKRLW